jgi:alkylation response protein AidB-like acyl-CoA dehydrogenase
VDLRLTADEARFRDELCAWLHSVEVPDGLRDFGSTPTADDVPPARQWQRQLADAGWAALSWPTPHGRNASPAEQAIFAEELARRNLPRQLSFVTIELAGPILLRHGRPEQIESMVAPMVRGETIWCQLFSEPSAGSDLASLRTVATPGGNGWLVNGQKIWTSGAHYSDYGLLLARTDPSSQRHRGLSCFALPMDRAGIEVRPIRQLDGENKFNEVYLTDVRVQAEDLLGAPGDGWKVGLSVLGSERRMLGSVAIGLDSDLWRLREQVEDAGRDDAGFRERWVAVHTRVGLLRWTWFRFLSEADTGGTDIDSRTSVLKLVSSELQQEVGRFARDALGGPWALDPQHHGWRQAFLGSHGATIAGGTSEIQRNILGERVLGLPR